MLSELCQKLMSSNPKKEKIYAKQPLHSLYLLRWRGFGIYKVDTAKSKGGNHMNLYSINTIKQGLSFSPLIYSIRKSDYSESLILTYNDTDDNTHQEIL